MITRFKLYDLNVFGNEQDGFEIDSWQQIDTLEICEDDITCENIINLLMQKDYLCSCAIDVEIHDQWIYTFETYTGRPLFNLQEIL